METTAPLPQRHPCVTFWNAINSERETRCFPSEVAAFGAASTEHPYNNTRITLGYCQGEHCGVGEPDEEPPTEEPPTEDYDPGPEIDDEGGMSEHRYDGLGLDPGDVLGGYTGQAY